YSRVSLARGSHRSLRNAALLCDDRQHDEQADECDKGPRQRRDRIEPIIPFEFSVDAAHRASPFDATFRREKRSQSLTENSSELRLCLALARNLARRLMPLASLRDGARARGV